MDSCLIVYVATSYQLHKLFSDQERTLEFVWKDWGKHWIAQQPVRPIFWVQEAHGTQVPQRTVTISVNISLTRRLHRSVHNGSHNWQLWVYSMKVMSTLHGSWYTKRQFTPKAVIKCHFFWGFVALHRPHVLKNRNESLDEILRK